VALALVIVWLTLMLLGSDPPEELQDAVLLALGYVFGAKGAQAAEGVARAAVKQAESQATAPPAPPAHDHADPIRPQP
jgi:hypothetical protein